MVALGGGAVSYERGTPVWDPEDPERWPRAPLTPRTALQGYRAHKKTPPPLP